MSASSDVTAGTTLTASSYNNLRADAINTTSGHIHDGTAAKTMLGTAVPLIDAAAGSAGTVGTSLLLARQDHVHPGVALHASHTYLAGTISSNLTASTALTYRDGPTVTLTAGTWLITAHAQVSNNAATGLTIVKLWNGTTIAAGAEVGLGAAYTYNVGLSAVVIATGSETWKLSFTNSVAGTATLYYRSGNDTNVIGTTRINATLLGHVAG